MNLAAKSKILLLSAAIAAALSALMLGGIGATANLGMQNGLYSLGTPLSDIVIFAIDDKAMQEIGRWPWDRTVWAGAIDKVAPAAKVIGIDVSFFESSSAESDASLAEALSRNGNVVISSEHSKFSSRDGKLYGEEVLKPIFDSATGFANIFTDADGIARAVPVKLEGTENLSSLSYAVLEKYLGSAPSIPEDMLGRMLVNFFGKPGAYRRISLADLDETPAEELSGKIILMGATAPDLHDERLTPVSGQAMPGVEIHANAIQTMLTRAFLRYQDAGTAALVIFAFSLAVGLLVSRFKIIIATAGTAAILVAYVGIAFAAFDSGLILNMLYPVLAVSLSYVAAVAYSYVSESKQKTFVTNLFGKYVSADIVGELLKNPEQIKLGGRKKEMSILFSDIRGFTSISEKLKPEELVHFLNEYLTAMSDVIMKDRGVVDKYIGDAIMAFWGAPLDDAEHAKKACIAAMDMMAELEKLKQKWKAEGRPLDVNIGIGINSGDAVVGNMGSHQRFSYTVMGDNVNLASRLESLNKEYGTSIIVSEQTYEEVKDSFFVRELDLVKVKGKQKPVRIYELMAKAGEESEKHGKIKAIFEEGLQLYRQQKWQAASKVFSEAAKLGDNTSEVFAERCKELAKERLPKDWNGVFEAKTK
jgi:adenylate cyclase